MLYILFLALSLRNQVFERKLYRQCGKNEKKKKAKENTRPKYDEKKKLVI